jgi:hypothetical protein
MTIRPQNQEADLVGLSRISIVNQLLAVKDSLFKRAPDYNMHGLVDQNKLAWFLKQVGHLGNRHYPYQSYVNPALNDGVFRMEPGAGPATVALVADWASSTAESTQIAQLVGIQDYSIHMGDTYYIGNSKEISDNFNDTVGGPWPYGKHGSFAMLGNHEMYSSGKPFFTELLPYMGVITGSESQRQEASFFCLENDYWRIIALDTGYDSLKGLLGLNPNTGLNIPDKEMDWLADTVRPAKDKRGIILLSHHQCFSAFDKYEFQAILPQILPLLGQRDVLWFWGHEHRLSFYGYNQLGNNVGCFSRCIGHGGMPIELGEFNLKGAGPADKANRNLVLYDQRLRKTIADNIALGHNGYVLLELSGPKLVVKYYDDSFVDAHGLRSPIVMENWSVDIATGALKGEDIVDYTNLQPAVDPRLTQFQTNIKFAINQTGA